MWYIAVSRINSIKITSYARTLRSTIQHAWIYYVFNRWVMIKGIHTCGRTPLLGLQQMCVLRTNKSSQNRISILLSFARWLITERHPNYLPSQLIKNMRMTRDNSDNVTTDKNQKYTTLSLTCSVIAHFSFQGFGQVLELVRGVRGKRYVVQGMVLGQCTHSQMTRLLAAHWILAIPFIQINHLLPIVADKDICTNY